MLALFWNNFFYYSGWVFWIILIVTFIYFICEVRNAKDIKED